MIATHSDLLKTLSLLGLWTLSVGLAQAQTWTVREYGDPNDPWTSEDPNTHPCGCISVTGGDDKLIVITANPTRELRFEIYYADPNGVYDSQAPLNDLTITPDVDAELIEISILGDSSLGHTFGASDIAKMNIAPDDFSNFGGSVLKGLKISGDLSRGDHSVVDDVEGDVWVGGQLWEDGWQPSQNKNLSVAGDLVGDVHVAKLFGGIIVPGGTVTGDISTGAVPGAANTPGRIEIGGNYSDTITINDGFSGQIIIGDQKRCQDDFLHAASGMAEGTYSPGVRFLFSAQTPGCGDRGGAYSGRCTL